MMKRLFLLAAALLLFGCIDQSYYQEYAGSGVILNLSDATEACPTGQCICMVCETFPNPDDDPATQFYPFSYWASDCRFLPCTFEQYQEYMRKTPLPTHAPRESSGEDMLNYFMFGQGGFGEFNKANPYCNNSLRMPVKWLDSRYGGGEYPIPDPDRARCFADKGAMPLYILYSRGEAIDSARSAEIAELFEKGFLFTGPIIITSEFEFDSSNPETVSKVRDQVIAMKQACPHCQIALAPRIWDDSDELDALMSDPLVNSSVDLFAYGLNSHDFTRCNPALMYSDGIGYSQYLLYKYKKPSVWAYILFDKDYSADGSCEWDDRLIAEGYSKFFSYPQAFASSGVIGGALYSLYGVADPLGCKDCGLFDASGEPMLPRQPTWFSNCQGAYGTSSITPVLYSDAPGTYCQFSQPTYSYVGADYNTEQPLPGEPAGSWPVFYSCDSCLVEKNPTSAKLTPITPSNPTVGGEEVDLCTAYPALDAYADIRDLDPALVRATVLRESAFDPCSTSKDVHPCGKTPGMHSVSDPDLMCPDYSYPSGSYVCAMGLMQTLAPPYTYWEEIDFAHEGQMEDAKFCAEEEKFNPYNPEHSACIGTAELADAVAAAKQKVRNNADKILGGIDLESDEYGSMEGVVTVMVARLYYAGPALVSDPNIASWANGFEEFRDAERTCRDSPDSHPCCDGSRVKESLARAGCCGSGADFVNYVTNEQCYDIRPRNSNEGGSNKPYIVNTNSFVRMYLGLREKCGICDKDTWDENIDEWAASASPAG